jgi:hypothetical protein
MQELTAPAEEWGCGDGKLHPRNVDWDIWDMEGVIDCHFERK